MESKPVYVEIDINTEMDKLWTATQTPNLHEKWDLRFSSITYLPKKGNNPQHFSYKRTLVFGKSIEGWGITIGSHDGKNGERTSSLHFGTDDVLSPIKEGRGYWKYLPNDNSITFLTQYDYDVNFGKFGQMVDRLIFRPLIGWGTALSFDVLKRWIEKEETPFSQYVRFFLGWMITFLVSFVWIYHGLIPKLIFKHPDEVFMLTNVVPLSYDVAYWIVMFAGISEIILGVLFLLYRNKRVLFRLQIIIFPLLTITAIMADPSTLTQPFNPLTFNLSLFVLSIAGFVLTKDLPTASSCKRKR
ncbi:DoxX-like family protein [Ureibacillus acetophenoni]|uniref:DoxX-like protein n=1 Tax=Ureibacillus acetophenoni TaxID=614649 RepID=A0A285UL87_9BACL|nr:DoxX-like family protein [Ureibacillus acetophenoni]SOC42665.1 DoxX-like protein [Ureibacillus acetophenoni]